MKKPSISSCSAQKRWRTKLSCAADGEAQAPARDYVLRHAAQIVFKLCETTPPSLRERWIVTGSGAAAMAQVRRRAPGASVSTAAT